jgi:hypothetical protein
VLRWSQGESFEAAATRYARDRSGRDAIAMTSATPVMEIRGSVRYGFSGTKIKARGESKLILVLLRDVVPDAGQAPRHIGPGSDKTVRSG